MRPLYLILLLLWFIASYLLCQKYYTCSPSTDAVSEAAVGGATGAAAAAATGDGCSTELKFEDADFMISTSENFRFSINEETQNEPSDALTDVLDKVQDYLSTNDTQFMQLTGYFLDGEENASEYENLGIARAKSVREYLKERGIDGTQMTTNGQMIESECVEDGVLLKGISVVFDKIP